MIVFLAGVPARVQACPNAHLYEHVLFSMAVNLKKDMIWMFARKTKEIKLARQQGETSTHSKDRKLRRRTSTSNGGA